MYYPKTWSCWDVESLTAIMKVPELAEADMFCARTVSKTPNKRYKLLVSGVLRWNVMGSLLFNGKFVLL